MFHAMFHSISFFSTCFFNVEFLPIRKSSPFRIQPRIFGHLVILKWIRYSADIGLSLPHSQASSCYYTASLHILRTKHIIYSQWCFNQLLLIPEWVSHQFCAINNEIWNRGSRNSFARESPVSAMFVLYVCIAIRLLVCCEGRTVVAPRASCFRTISHREHLFPQ